MIAAFEQALPGLGREIMDGFVEERKHRHTLDMRRAEADDRNLAASIQADKRGNWFAFILSIVIAGVAAYAFRLGYPSSATIVIGANLIGLATVFISGRKPRQNEEARTPPEQASSK